MLLPKSFRFLLTLLLLILWAFVPVKMVQSQDSPLLLEFELSPVLENAQLLSLTGLGIDAQGAGPVLLTGRLINQSSERVENLYLEFRVEASRVGLLAEFIQRQAFPFSLDPNQIVNTTNNDIQNEEIPGIEEKLDFDGGLTLAGEEFIENLSGTTLPSDIYTFSIVIYQVTNATGRRTMAAETVVLGVGNRQSVDDPVVFDEESIFLRAPGDVLGTEVSITNLFPQFSWEGDAANEFRLVVVRSNGQDTPESLLQNAYSSEPVDEGGQLLQFENLDVLVDGNTFQYPPSGAQALQYGQTYFWQLSTEIQTAIGTEIIISDIWGFRLVSPSENTGAPEIDGDQLQALIALIGQEQFNTLTENGYAVASIEIEGVTYEGPAAINKLEELFEKITNGDIIVNN